ncbi:MAG: hypothetical protein R6U41_11980 [Desulfosalsimonas sp.]|uniref:hypothetical protein n=1 Tax=Desulfosalsimonas sp. TaxID=3073848 RepID=UPI003970FFDF
MKIKSGKRHDGFYGTDFAKRRLPGFSHGRGVGAALFACGSLWPIVPGLWLEFQKLRLIALRQFEIPGAKAPGQSFGQTAPMQSNKPSPTPAHGQLKVSLKKCIVGGLSQVKCADTWFAGLISAEDIQWFPGCAFAQRCQASSRPGAVCKRH